MCDESSEEEDDSKEADILQSSNLGSKIVSERVDDSSKKELQLLSSLKENKTVQNPSEKVEICKGESAQGSVIRKQEHSSSDENEEEIISSERVSKEFPLMKEKISEKSENMQEAARMDSRECSSSADNKEEIGTLYFPIRDTDDEEISIIPSELSTAQTKFSDILATQDVIIEKVSKPKEEEIHSELLEVDESDGEVLLKMAEEDDVPYHKPQKVTFKSPEWEEGPQNVELITSSQKVSDNLIHTTKQVPPDSNPNGFEIEKSQDNLPFMENNLSDNIKPLLEENVEDMRLDSKESDCAEEMLDLFRAHLMNSSKSEEALEGRKSPKVPLKTYMWEDVRRSKLKGGYPWTHLYKGSLDEETFRSYLEHEYEPITPRSEHERPRSPFVGMADPAGDERRERRFIRIPDSDQIIIPLHGSSDEEYNPDRYEDKELVCQEEVSLQVAYRPTPSPSPRPQEPPVKLSERLRSTAGQLSSSIRKISLPDKSKIRMPETPKFLKEKPKFLTEKPKFLTEKPKFLTEKPKFLTEKPKFLTERPKFLKERPKLRLPDRSKFKFPDRPKINMPHIKLPKRTKSAKESTTTSTVKSEFGSEKNIFENLKAKTYPRFFNKKKKERGKKITPPPTKFDSESLPSTPQSKRNEKWVDVYKERKYEEKSQSLERNGESFQERYAKREAKRASSSSIVDSDREQVSSGSSTQRHRAGVIEEIDSDEFFVRVKGISREDVDVSRYLSSEIREAFRSPKNALESLDLEDMEDEGPVKPERSKAPKEYPRKEFNTFPLRPSRAKASNDQVEKPPRRFRSKNRGKQSSLPSLSADQQQYELDAASSPLPPLPPKRRKSAKDLHDEQDWPAEEAHIVPAQVSAQDAEGKVTYDIPVAPIRKARSQGTSLGDEDRTSRGAESIRSEVQLDDEILDERFQMEVEDPISRETVKVNYEDDMKHGYDLIDDVPPKRPDRSRSRDKSGYAVVSKVKPTRPPPPQKRQVQRQLQTWKTQGVNFFLTYPRRAIKSLNRLPKRPVRNYSTIAGPTRPPRRSKVFREPVYVDGDLENDVPFIDDDEENKERLGHVGEKMKGRPLPPPPRPPRKTRDGDSIDRKSFTTEEMNILNDLDTQEIEESALVTEDTIITQTIVGTALTGYNVNDRVKRSPPPTRPGRKSSYTSSKDTSIKPTAEISQQTSFDVTEITVSVQTDPLPEGFIVEDSEMLPIKSDVEPDEQQSIEKYLEKYENEFKMLGRSVAKPTPIVAEKGKLSDIKPPEKKVIEPIKLSEEVTEKKEINEEISESKIVKEKLKEVHVTKEVVAKKEEHPRVVDSEKKVEKEEKLKDEESKTLKSKFIELTSSDRLHLSQLDVDNLNVSSLKASQILVSDMSGQSLQVAELTSRGGNLVVSGVQFPQEFIQSITNEIQSRVEASPKAQKKTVVTAPPPIVVQHSAELVSPPSPEFPSAGDNLPKPKTTRSRGRRSPTRIIDDSEDELAATMPSRPAPSHPQPSTQLSPALVPPPSATQLLLQLLNIWRGYLIEGFSSCYNTLNNIFPEGDKRRDAQTAAVILFVLIGGLIALGFGTDNTVHHHHWDFVPPRK